MPSRLAEFAHRHVDAGTVPGMVASIGRDDNPEVVTVGVASKSGKAIEEDTIFRIQSMTKVVVAVAALRLVEAGKISLDSDVGEWLPELADRRVLRMPSGPLSETDPGQRPITLRHLLTCTSGYGIILEECPLQHAMIASGTDVSADPPTRGADEWLGRLAELPLAFQPGEGWRYHHSFAILGILVARVSGRALNDHLRSDLFEPLGMIDTGLWVPESALDRLSAAYRSGVDGRPVETEPTGGGFYAGEPEFDVSHGELVSTEKDFRRFCKMLAGGGSVDGQRVISGANCELLGSDQVRDASKSPDGFFPGFWKGTGWGYGVAVRTEGPHEGRIDWAGGQGTSFFIDPDGTIGILLTQVELGESMWPVLTEFQEVTG